MKDEKVSSSPIGYKRLIFIEGQGINTCIERRDHAPAPLLQAPVFKHGEFTLDTSYFSLRLTQSCS